MVNSIPGRIPNRHKAAAHSQSLLYPGACPRALPTEPVCGHVLPDVGLVAVVLPRQVPGGAPVGDLDHGDLFAVASQVAWGGAEAWALRASAQGICDKKTGPQLRWGGVGSTAPVAAGYGDRHRA